MCKRNERLLIAWLVTALLLATVTPQAQPENRPSSSPNEVVCRLLPGITIEEINSDYGTRTRGYLDETDIYLLMISPGQNPDSMALLIDTDPRVDFCRPNHYLAAPEGFQRSSPFPDVELIGDMDEQPAVTILGLPTAAAIATGAGTRIALIDGGVEYSHPVFSLASGELLSRWDYVDEDSLAQAESLGSCAAHGTFVAGLLHLVAPGADVYVYKVLDTAGQGTAFSIAAAVLQAVEDSCDVINLSLGMVGIDEGLDEALRIAHQSGLTVVASAGNDSTDLNSIFPFPASRTYALAVAALDSLNRKADFSNYGLRIDLCGPGTGIYSAYSDSLYAWWDGTSFAAPFVTGLVALILEQNGNLTPEQVDTILARSAVSVDSLNPGLEGQLGDGLIDPVQALALSVPVEHGDVTVDGVIDIGDVTALVGYLFRGQPLDFFANPDANCDGAANVADLVMLVEYLYHQTSLPCTSE